MTHEEKIEFMRIAASLCNLGFTDKQLDLLISLYDAVTEMKGDMTLRDTARIEAAVEHRANVKSRTKLLDKVSEKV